MMARFISFPRRRDGQPDFPLRSLAAVPHSRSLSPFPV